MADKTPRNNRSITQVGDDVSPHERPSTDITVTQAARVAVARVDAAVEAKASEPSLDDTFGPKELAEVRERLIRSRQSAGEPSDGPEAPEASEEEENVGEDTKKRSLSERIAGIFRRSKRNT